MLNQAVLHFKKSQIKNVLVFNKTKTNKSVWKLKSLNLNSEITWGFKNVLFQLTLVSNDTENIKLQQISLYGLRN